MSKKQFNQLSLVQRSQLQTLLKEKDSLAKISVEMNLSRQTLYREILRNSFPISCDKPGLKSSCINYLKCHKEKKSYRLECPSDCINYQPGRQYCLKKYPFVCNNCKKKKCCNFLHYYYDAENASNSYHQRINKANAFPKTDEKIIKQVNNIVSPLIKNGQSIEAILMNHPELKVSSITIRNWIKNRILDCNFSELRMAGRRTQKIYNYSSNPNHIRLSEAKIGHKYNDFRLFKSLHPNCLTIQLDSVIGNIDGVHSVLTIHIVEYKFQFGILLNSKESNEVYQKLNDLLSKLKSLEDSSAIAVYSTFSECWLTDNGIEFDNILSLIDNHKNLNIFFCHPYSSFEKGACERNHVLVRYIHFKGWSFDNLNQQDINVLFSNINSYPRLSLNKKTPYQCVLEDSRLGKEFLDLINIFKVNCDDVNLTPSLLKKIKK